MMKTPLLLIIFLIVCFTMPAVVRGQGSQKGTVYYVSQNGGNGDGTSDATAWSFSKLNTARLLPGSTILFKRGDYFYGSLNTNIGNSDNPITYGAYGSGANPVITGLSTPTSWTASGANIYYTTIDVPELNVVVLDGKVRPMGRFPKTGYLVFNEHSENNWIGGPSIGSLPFNPTGGEVVIRKIRQITDRHIITSHSGNRLGLSSGGAYGTVFLNNTNDGPMDGNGYFIQAHIKTLTDLGDWYYDKANKRLYMHFGSGSPDGHNIKVSTVATLAQMDNKSQVVFNNIDFEGANRNAITMNNNDGITFIDCNFSKSFGALFGDNGVRKLTFQGGSMTDILSSAIFIPSNASGITVDNVRITDTGIIPGAGGSGGAQQVGVWLAGDNLTVRNSIFKNIGFHAIALHGDHTLVEQNLIDRYGVTKDDCGGVYEFQFANVTSTDKIIRKNIILNGIGEPTGAPAWEQYGQASAIYLDVAVNNVQVSDNVLAHGNWGGLMLIGAGVNNKLTNNLVYDFSKGLLIYSFESLKIRNTTVTGNTFIAKTAKQYPCYLQMYASDDPSQYGTFNNNVYARPIDDNNSIGVNKEYSGGSGLTILSLATWKSNFGQDGNSSKSLVAAEQESSFRFDYNYANDEVTLPLSSIFSDVRDNIYTSNVKVPAFGGSVLVKVANIVQTVNSGKWNDPGVWSGGSVPGTKEYVIINKGHTVTADQNISPKNIHVNGELLFLGDYKVE
ncbi:right-handed parallel beta-helix repeat-containing protein [Dyadobacter luticola]|uniref:Right handed beta helix domain-containing protein n=1 Tax=Dyadobacter luticola TaxID=1979387 RepID=A0A5R9L5U2_9BACT|nr:right-handed parallel beta-helix repeat-containing protein [Dyadobacter luticola]TLV03717.1 hypothetical protein FEN17_08995 [Dyadobacter luticola]